MCVPCEAKKILDEQAQGFVDEGEKARKKVQKMVEKGRLTEDQAAYILEPYMQVEGAFVSVAPMAVAVSAERLASEVGE